MNPTMSRRQIAGMVALFAGFWVAPPAVAQVEGQAAAVSQTAPGAARFWFYRVFFPEDSGGMPLVSVNGAPIGYALAGTSFYRDIPAGYYHLTVASEGLDLYQSQQVAVAPGQEVYVKIASLPSWQDSARGRQRDGTYYVMLVSPRLASLEMPVTRYASGY